VVRAEDIALRAQRLFEDRQHTLCAELSALDGAGTFKQDRWERPGGGGGISAVLTDGALFEKAGVNTSTVWGEFDEIALKKLGGGERAFHATGISMVFHPRSPMVPTVHANFRFLSKGERQWFGGGADLTPYYPYREDVIHFHRTWKQACENHAPLIDHARLKKWCDEYFFLPHRNECRGVGGIFFDYLEGDLEKLFAFVREAGEWRCR